MNNSNKSQFFSTREETSRGLDSYDIKNYTINDDLTVDIRGDVDLSNSKSLSSELISIPIRFRKVTGNFWCNNNRLISLVGSPKTVGGSFWCHNNNLSNLIGSPETVGGSFACEHNNLTNLTGISKSIAFNFYCDGNPLISLVEMINCNLKGKIYFNIDENNFLQKKLIEILKKYYDVNGAWYQLTFEEFRDKIKPILEREYLLDKLNKSNIYIKTKKKFI